MSKPTKEQLEKAGLVEVTTYEDIMVAESNGYPARTYDATTEKFPPISNAYVSKNWQIPPTKITLYGPVIGGTYLGEG